MTSVVSSTRGSNVLEYRAPRPRLSAIVSALPAFSPFVGPETIERRRGAIFRARIGANENPFGASPLVLEALRASTHDMWMYGDPENNDLRWALADYHGIAPANICVAEGIDALLGYAVRTFVDAGSPVVASQGTYPTFSYQVFGHGGRLIEVPYDDDTADTDGLADAARQESARIVYLANPDNPMGTWNDRPFVNALIEKLPENCVLLLDEAYADFASEGILTDKDVGDSRVLRFRTFSKAHGLAGLRIGYVIGEQSLINAFERIRNHFAVNRMAQAAAMAALDDQDHLDAVVRQVADARQRITEIAAKQGLSTVPSSTNFVAIDCGRDGDFAKRVLNALEEQSVFVRMPGSPPQNRCIRISAGLPAEIGYFEEVFPEALAQASEQPSNNP